jgi:hypothetical protein
MDVETENLTENIEDRSLDSKISVPHESNHAKNKLKQFDESTLASSIVEVDINALPPTQMFRSLTEVDEGNKMKLQTSIH